MEDGIRTCSPSRWPVFGKKIIIMDPVREYRATWTYHKVIIQTHEKDEAWEMQGKSALIKDLD
jgi:hypothetical protein